MEEVELTTEQEERIDDIEEAVYQLCLVMTEREDYRYAVSKDSFKVLPFDESVVGDIADVVAEMLVSKGFPVRYPARIEEPDGSITIEDYVWGLKP